VKKKTANLFGVKQNSRSKERNFLQVQMSRSDLHESITKLTSEGRQNVEETMENFTSSSRSILGLLQISSSKLGGYKKLPHQVAPLQYSSKSKDLTVDYDVYKLVNDNRLRRKEKENEVNTNVFDKREEGANVDAENFPCDDNDDEGDDDDDDDDDSSKSYITEPLYSLRRRRRRRLQDQAREENENNHNKRRVKKINSVYLYDNIPRELLLHTRSTPIADKDNHVSLNTYHEHIYNSAVLWNFYMAHLTTDTTISNNSIASRKFFYAWKKYSWVRILRIKRARWAVKKWNFLSKNNKISRPAKSKATRHLLSKMFLSLRRRSTKTIYSTRRRNMAKATIHCKNEAKCRAVHHLRDHLAYKTRLRVLSSTLKSKCTRFLLENSFCAWVCYNTSIPISHEATTLFVFRKLRQNVENRSRLSALHDCATNYGNYKSRQRGFGVLRRNVCSKKDFRKKLKEAFKLPTKSLLRHRFTSWKAFTSYFVNEREKRMLTATIYYDKFLLRHCFGIVKRKYVQFKTIQVRAVDFKVWKLRRGVKKFKVFLRQQRAIKRFSAAVKDRERKRYRRLVWETMKLRAMVAKRGAVVQATRVGNVKRCSFRFINSIFIVRQFRAKRLWFKLLKVFVAWYECSGEQRKLRERLVSFTWSAWRRKVLRVAGVHGLAKNFLANKCGRAFVKFCFVAWKKYAVVAHSGKIAVFRISQQKRVKELRLAVCLWKDVNERVRWHTGILQVCRRRGAEKLMRIWRAHAVEEREDRLRCEYGERHLRRRLKAVGWETFVTGTRKIKCKRAEITVAVKYRRRVELRRAIGRLKANVGLVKVLKRNTNVAVNAFAKKKKLLALCILREFARKERVRKVATAAAFLMYQKSYLTWSIKIWKRRSRRSAALKNAFGAGKRLMMAFALMQWKSYRLLLINKRRYVRRLMLQWKSQIEYEKCLYRWRLMNRVFERFKTVCSKLKKRRVVVRKLADAVVRERKRRALGEWLRVARAERFGRGKGAEIRCRRLFRTWKEQAAVGRKIQIAWGEWMGDCFRREEREGGKNAGVVIWRWLAVNVRLRVVVGMWNFWSTPTTSFVGDVRLQCLHIYFNGWQGWWMERGSERLANEKSLECWRRRLLGNCVRGWAMVRRVRVKDEGDNMKSLDFWYNHLLRRCMGQWIIRTAHFARIREEAEAVKRKGGFDRFVAGVMETKIWRIQVAAANEMGRARGAKIVRRLFRYWIGWASFEKSERLLWEQRDGERKLIMQCFLLWRMRTRAILLTKLTYRDIHDDHYLQEYRGLKTEND